MIAPSPRILDGRWALPADFRDGATGRVFRATDLLGEIKDFVAVKIVGPSIRGDRGLALQVFQREYESLSRLKHANVVELLDGGRDQETGERYFVFPWLEKGFNDHVREHPLAGWDDFWERYGRELLDGLSYAHSQAVAHRDIKPQNVLITDHGRPCISDFGIAKIVSRIAPELTLRDHVTRPFAPPEYDDGRFPTQRDVYSWAVLTMMALTEIDPFDGYEEEPYRAVDDAIRALDVPEDIDVLFRRCVHEDPSARPHDATKLKTLIDGIEDKRQSSRATLLQIDKRRCHLVLTGKAKEALMNALDLQAEAELEDLIQDDLEEGAALLPFDRPTFEDGSPTDGHYFLIGAELRFHLTIDERREYLAAVNAWAVQSSLLERERERGWQPPWEWSWGQPFDSLTAQETIDELQREVSAHTAEERARRRKAAEERPIQVWRSTLAALRSIEKDKESPIRYWRASEDPSGIEFQTKEDLSQDLIGQVRVVRGVEGQYLSGEVIDVKKDAMVLFPARGDFHSLPSEGELKLDTTASRSALRRQDQALDALQYERTLSPDLRKLLVAPSTAAAPHPVNNLSWRQPLDLPKKQAVQAALGVEDLLLVEGPPGTGKTTFITELILQYLTEHPDGRILVSSQTNAALDNVLERLLQAEPGLRQVRIARSGDERISAPVRPLLLDEQVERWRGEITAAGRQWLDEWATARGVSVDQLEMSMRFEELARERRGLEALKVELQEIITRLDRLNQAEEEGLEDATAALSQRLEENHADQAGSNSASEVAVAALIGLGAISKAKDLDDLSIDELEERALETMPVDGAAASECRELVDLLSDWHARFGRGAAFRSAALLRANVVAATCIGYASVKGSDAVEFDLCIIDEASKATATEMLVPMTRARRWIIVGDQRQLPPFIEDALRKPKLLSEYRLNRDEIEATLFDRLRTQLPPECKRVLSRQHRMVPSIGDMVSSCFYEGELSSEPRASADWLHLLAPSPVCWFTTSHLSDRSERRRGTSITNSLEARAIAVLLGRANFAAKAGGQKLTVVVLTGYAGQRDLIQREIASQLREWRNLQIECSTVDAFQGREADIAIYSVTRSNSKGSIGFLSEERRLNVALSRGREALIIIGDHAGVRTTRGLNPFLPVLDYIERHDNCSLKDMEL